MVSANQSLLLDNTQVQEEKEFLECFNEDDEYFSESSRSRDIDYPICVSFIIFYIFLLTILTTGGGLLFFLIENYWDADTLDFDKFGCLTQAEKEFVVENHATKNYTTEWLKELQRKQLNNTLKNLRQCLTPFLNLKDYMNSFYFSWTLYTTVGFGDVAPSSSISRVASCVYALIAIPFFLAIKAEFGQYVSLGVLAIMRKVKLKISLMRNADCEIEPTEMEKFITVAFISIVHLCLVSVFVMLIDGQMTYSTSLYFTYIGQSTIGLGDVTTSKRTYFIVLAFPLFFLGDTWLAQYNFFMQKLIREIIAWTVESCLCCKNQVETTLEQATALRLKPTVHDHFPPITINTMPMGITGSRSPHQRQVNELKACIACGAVQNFNKARNVVSQTTMLNRTSRRLQNLPAPNAQKSRTKIKPSTRTVRRPPAIPPVPGFDRKNEEAALLIHKIPERTPLPPTPQFIKTPKRPKTPGAVAGTPGHPKLPDAGKHKDAAHKPITPKPPEANRGRVVASPPTPPKQPPRQAPKQPQPVGDPTPQSPEQTKSSDIMVDVQQTKAKVAGREKVDSKDRQNKGRHSGSAEKVKPSSRERTDSRIQRNKAKHSGSAEKIKPSSGEKTDSKDRQNKAKHSGSGEKIKPSSGENVVEQANLVHSKDRAKQKPKLIPKERPTEKKKEEKRVVQQQQSHSSGKRRPRQPPEPPKT